MNHTDTTTQDPAAIERDIRQTQDEMSRTVGKIGDQLSPKSIANALFEKAEERGVDANAVVEAAKRNPIAAAMAIGGALWLLSGKEAKLPSLNSSSSAKGHYDPSESHHRDYVSHMSQVEMREGEDPVAYQRRRDIARANYFMLERTHDEDEGSFRKRLDDTAEKLRQRRHEWAEQGSRTRERLIQKGQQGFDSLSRTGQQGAEKSKQIFDENPLVGGLLAAAAGAAVGTVLPLSRTEQEQLQPLGETVRDAAGQQAETLTETLREKKDELVEKIDQQVQPTQNGAREEQQTQLTPQYRA